ncbi:hypothetical protein TNCV_2335011 [Trichonephila clavipes]|uniref:Uncharacterized protein n=1 Tax=Trichonephila clavipes TaxID=2585209 RepID=A0A8X6VCF9_TRICX|nr:hypothetical protein TNCV_2335011 [Trichonephila clavipes]
MSRIREKGTIAKYRNACVPAEADFVDQETPVTSPDDSPAPPSVKELAGTPKVGPRCVSGWGTRIWIRISETLNFAGYCRNEVQWLCVRVPRP